MGGNLIKYPLGADMGFGYSTSCGGSGGGGGGGGGTAVPFSSFSEVNSVIAGSIVNIIQFAVPLAQKVMLYHVDFAGSNIGDYELYFDANKQARTWTWFNGPMFGSWDFSLAPYGGLVVAGGTVISVKVSHGRPFLGTFSARIVGIVY